MGPRLFSTGVFLVVVLTALIARPAEMTTRRIAIEWSGGRPQGRVSITDGSLLSLSVARGEGAVEGSDRFTATRDGSFRLDIRLKGSEAAYGPGRAIVTAGTSSNPFSFFLRDVRSDHPICIPQYGAAVTDAADTRPYAQIEAAIRGRGLQSKLERIESEPEETFENAAANTRSLSCQTWLGLSRDMRIFGLKFRAAGPTVGVADRSDRLDWIQPRFHGRDVGLPESRNQPVRYAFAIGRGWGPLDRLTRRLEDGTLPILHGALEDEDITYNVIALAGLESQPLTAQSLRGTHFLVADGHSVSHMFTKEQQAEFERLLPAEMNQPEETVLYMRITAVNTAAVSRYAFFKNPAPSAYYPPPPHTPEHAFDGGEGFGLYNTGRVFVVSKLNGKPLAQEDVAIELQPGESADIDVFLPHRPVSRERALKLREVDFEQRRENCRAFWREKLASAAQVYVPEPRINEMMRAGLLHLDLIAYGLEPEGTVTPTIGAYSAIGSESSPIIQYFDSAGWHDLARRALMYFLDKQHEDGLIQNFGRYMIETGAALWSMGEHYRYTRDDNWVRRIEPRLIRSCEFLRRWRQRNLREDLRGKGYGLLDGKAADPDDPFRFFMLNGYAHLGLQRVAEMLEGIDPAQSQEWRAEAESLKADIRKAFFEVMGKSPAIPLANGMWCPTVPPWVEYRGPLVLLADGVTWASHGALGRDSVLGPLYLIFQEVIDPTEPAADFLLEFHKDLLTLRNVAFIQPYYSRHPVCHLRRGEVKSFLSAYYNTAASLVDRQTYTFWECYYGASPHKTHEEGWFLMDTRWMLYMERGDTLDVFPGIPRKYLDSGNRIELKRVATYFGPASVQAISKLDQGRIEATVECPSDRRPKAVELRLPHPQRRKATWVRGGSYNAETERVRIEPFDGHASVTLGFGPQRGEPAANLQ